MTRRPHDAPAASDSQTEGAEGAKDLGTASEAASAGDSEAASAGDAEAASAPGPPTWTISMTPDGNIDHAATEKYTEQEQRARHEHFRTFRANRSGLSQTATAAKVPSDPEAEFAALEEAYDRASPKKRKEIEQRMKDLRRRLR